MHRVFLGETSIPNPTLWSVSGGRKEREEKKGILRTVSKMPGEIEFTLIFGPTTVARDLIRWICAAFVTE